MLTIEKRPLINEFESFLFSSYRKLSGSRSESGIFFSEILTFADHSGFTQKDSFIDLILSIDEKVREMQDKQQKRDSKMQRKSV